MKGLPVPAAKSSAASTWPKSAALTNPMGALLLAGIPVTDGDFEVLASERAKVVRTYIISTGKVEAARLFLTENHSGGVRSNGSRVYLQFR